MDQDFQVSFCPPDERAAAFRLLHAGLPEDQQAGLVQVLNSLSSQREQQLAGLLVAYRDSQMVSACWVQPAPGRIAVVWPPSFDDPAAEALLGAAVEYLDRQQVTLAQILASPDARVDQSILTRSGFNKLADLAYLVADRGFFPTSRPENTLQFELFQSRHAQRLEELIAQTYQGTLDCPDLNGVRQLSDVVAGYSSQGTSGDEHWVLARQDGHDVGVLLLAVHSPQQWELVYMGIVPSDRGKGYGSQLVQFACIVFLSSAVTLCAQPYWV